LGERCYLGLSSFYGEVPITSFRLKLLLLEALLTLFISLYVFLISASSSGLGIKFPFLCISNFLYVKTILFPFTVDGVSGTLIIFFFMLLPRESVVAYGICPACRPIPATLKILMLLRLRLGTGSIKIN
jgi:hypothetical protein